MDVILLVTSLVGCNPASGESWAAVLLAGGAHSCRGSGPSCWGTGLRLLAGTRAAPELPEPPPEPIDTPELPEQPPDKALNLSALI